MDGGLSDPVLPAPPAQEVAPPASDAGPPAERPADRDPADLLKRLYEGDEAAFEEFWRQHVRDVLRVAMRYIRNGADAQDVAQQVALAIYRRQQPYDPSRGEVGAWLNRLTRNTAISYYRRRSGAEVGSRMYERHATNLRGYDRDAEAGTMEQHRLIALRECLGCLPPRQREIMAMVLIEGLRPVEVACQLGITQAAVSGSLSRSIDKMKGCLKLKGWEPAG